MKDDLRHGMDVSKNPNDLFCYLYMTKSNGIQHLNSVAGKYIFLRRPEGERNPVWTLSLTFSPIQETRTFYYVGTDSFPVCLYHLIVHNEGVNKDFRLSYYVNLPYYLKITVELFLFAKTLKEDLAFELLLLMNDHVRFGSGSKFCMEPIVELFDLRSFVDIQQVCKFEHEFDDHLIPECSRLNRVTRITFRREELWKCLTMQNLLQMKFSSMYQPLVPEMIKDMESNCQMQTFCTAAIPAQATIQHLSLCQPVQNSGKEICQKKKQKRSEGLEFR